LNDVDDLSFARNLDLLETFPVLPAVNPLHSAPKNTWKMGKRPEENKGKGERAMIRTYQNYEY